MQILKTGLWILIAVVAVIISGNNWRDVTVSLWGDLQADIKLPVLLLAMVLIGAVPTWLAMRSKLWRLQRRPAVEVRPVPAPPQTSEAE